jgi:hypothetical protein
MALPAVQLDAGKLLSIHYEQTLGLPQAMGSCWALRGAERISFACMQTLRQCAASFQPSALLECATQVCRARTRYGVSVGKLSAAHSSRGKQTFTHRCRLASPQACLVRNSDCRRYSTLGSC